MKVFMIIKRLRYSGAYKMFMWVAKALANRGHEVTVFTFMKNDVEELQPNIRWIKADLERASLVRKVKEARRWMKETGADISISFLLDANIINTLACLGTKTKSIICERNDPYKPHYYKLKLTKPLFRLADGAVFQLPKVAEYYSMIKGHTAVIPNPVIPTSAKIELKSFEERENVIVSLGRYDIFQKRQDVLLNAFARFLQGHPDYILKFYGDGPDEDKIRKLVESLGITDNVIVSGTTGHSAQVLSKSKFFVLSSDFEGIPNTLMEAMSIGLPCISTRCRPGGAEFLIEDGKNGLLVDAGDTDGLFQAMNRMADAGIADSLGLEAKKVTERFSEERITDMWCEYVQ
jgi:glycosyltransferase involved in cell wall biosynthesis